LNPHCLHWEWPDDAAGSQLFAILPNLTPFAIRRANSADFDESGMFGEITVTAVNKLAGVTRKSR
jgi:hypothetical protein